MRTQKSIFPNGKQALGLLIFALGLSSCNAGTIWHFDQDQFAQDVRAGNVDFLKSVDFDQVDLQQITRLGANAAYYMAIVLDHLNLSPASEKLLRVEWQGGNGVWQEEAGKRLISDYLARDDYADAEDTAKAVFSSYPERSIYRQLVVAWYWQHKDANVLSGLARLKSMNGPDGRPVADPELDLFEAVSSQRLGKDGWPSLFVGLFTNQTASDLHVRAMDYLNQNSEVKAAFTEEQLDFFRAKALIAQTQFGPAIAALGPLIQKRSSLLFTPADLRDLSRAYIGSGAAASGARMYQSFVSMLLADGAGAPSLYAGYEALGHLERIIGSYAQSADAYQRAIGYAGDGHDYDRMVWWLLESRVDASPADAVPQFAKYAKLWHDPAFFNDVIGELSTDLIQRRAWSQVWTLYRAVDGYADPAAIARLAYIVASAMHAGYISLPADQATEQDLLHRVISLDADRYYTDLAAARLGQLPPMLAAPDPAESVAAATRAEDTDWERFVNGFLQYDLYKEAYARAREKVDVLGDGYLRTLADALHQHGDILESMRLMDALAFRKPILLSESDLKLLYPQAYDSTVERVAKREQLPLPVFYGMVREESYFDPSIVSSAGAVGLTQLMPSTGSDFGRRIGLKDPTLTSPEDNLAIGADYLRWLEDRFHDTGAALFAYNAGYTRVERWKERYGNLPDDLFLEAVPFDETQGYGKKILVSAVAYGYLYYGLSPVTVVKEILPSFQS